jgi:hypothetical protein
MIAKSISMPRRNMPEQEAKMIAILWDCMGGLSVGAVRSHLARVLRDWMGGFLSPATAVLLNRYLVLGIVGYRPASMGGTTVGSYVTCRMTSHFTEPSPCSLLPSSIGGSAQYWPATLPHHVSNSAMASALVAGGSLSSRVPR